MPDCDTDFFIPLGAVSLMAEVNRPALLVYVNVARRISTEGRERGRPIRQPRIV